MGRAIMIIDKGNVVLHIGVTVPPGVQRSAYTWSAELMVENLEEAFATLERFREWGAEQNQKTAERAKGALIAHLETIEHRIEQPDDFIVPTE